MEITPATYNEMKCAQSLVVSLHGGLRKKEFLLLSPTSPGNNLHPQTGLLYVKSITVSALVLLEMFRYYRTWP